MPGCFAVYRDGTNGAGGGEGKGNCLWEGSVRVRLGDVFWLDGWSDGLEGDGEERMGTNVMGVGAGLAEAPFTIAADAARVEASVCFGCAAVAEETCLEASGGIRSCANRTSGYGIER